MNVLIAVAGLIAVAAITPGPNNLIVMRTATHSGFTGALPAIAGIVVGGLTMLLLVAVGAPVLFAAQPGLYPLITIGGGIYLCWLGVDLVRESFAAPGTRTTTAVGALPAGVAGLFGFQFLNPKSWVMVLTASAAVGGGAQTTHSFLPLAAALFTVIPALCLTLWCSLGVVMSTHLDRPHVRSRLDRVMGVLLIASALLLVLPLIHAPQ